MNEPLSAREIEILRLAASGCTNGEIAVTLSLALNTVKWYSKRIYEKLAVANRAEAIQRAQLLGLLADDHEPAKPAPRHNLPRPLTTLVGRRAEIEGVKQRLKQQRLLTLTGPGGIGKTRLALQVAEELSGFFPDGICFVDLAGINEAALVASTIAQLLGVTESPDLPLPTRIQAALRDKQFLLVLDNFEHLLDAAPLVADLLAACRELTVLVTSREVLALYGEQEYAVPPLTLPDLEWFAATHLAPSDLLSSEALQLFEHCAQAVSPDFRLKAENAPAVASICLRLDGLPLAIELAAAYVKLLSPQAMLTQLDSLWLEMKRSLRNIPARQQTLRNTIAWSYRFLNEAERRLFGQLAVFRGGCTWEAIAAICADYPTAYSTDTLPEALLEPFPGALLEPLNGLVNKSLLWQRTDGHGQPRFGMLETIREYALSAWPAQGEVDASPPYYAQELALLRQRHAAFFLQLAEQAKPQLTTPQQLLWQSRLEAEHANLRAALTYLLATADHERALRLAWALAYFWDSRGYVSEGRAWLQEALTNRAGATIETQAKALDQAGFLAFRQGDYALARSSLEAAIALFAQAENNIGIAAAWQTLAAVDIDQGDYKSAQQRLMQSLALSRASAHHPGVGRALLLLGMLTAEQGQFGEACAYYQESLQVHQTLGDQVSIAAGFLNLGDTERALGNLLAARANFDESLRLARLLGHKALIGVALQGLGAVALAQQEYTQAQSYSEEALNISRQLGNKSSIGFALANLGDIARTLGEYCKALDYYCQKLQIMHEVGYKLPILSALEEIAALLSEMGQQAVASLRFLGAADHLRQETGIPVPVGQQATYECILTTLRQELGESAFNRLWQEGQRMPLSQIVTAATVAVAAVIGGSTGWRAGG